MDTVHWNQFAVCPRLKSLGLFGLKAFSSGLPILPLLEKITISLCPLTADMLAVLAQCERLVNVEYFLLNAIEPLGLPYQEALWPYFQRMRRFHFHGDLDLLISHFPQRQLSLTFLHLERSGSLCALDLNRFLHFCSQLTNLDLWSCKISFAGTLTVIVRQLRLLERLHLHDCRWEAAMPAPLPTPTKRLQTLWISADRDAAVDCDALLQLLAPHVRKLTLSICDFPSTTSAWMDSISQRVPKLQSLTIDYSEQRLFAGQLEEIRRVFGHLPRLKVTVWRDWSALTGRCRRNDEQTVMLNIAN